ncbi:hypothetical protein LYSHEL_25580 [Lysobacter helvus]|uniref:Conserved hypothetical protein CHP02391 domain-containing protein n=2 Tax=Lysobacteraceae TaxID=32033 RepID=A0ABM7Q8D3_9GAMM|nr:hypothetical protein LYSCAS_25580 [Lysobacter caseinilyticus]BCT96687.1 hypothetical protein LYSHEL_25580 [Lysobacter helvus]
MTPDIVGTGPNLSREQSMAFWKLIPDVSTLLALEPEELGAYVLRYLSTAPETELNSYNFTLAGNVAGYPAERASEAQRALMEAWVWLEREGLLAPRPGNSGNWSFITRRGQRLAGDDVQFAVFRMANLLPKERLHPTIASKVWSAFLRGEYDTSVFQSFKELEVSTRNSCAFAETDIGVDMMRRAFKPSIGPLADKTAPFAEQEALMHLMAGAIGSYKNPHSHRSVSIDASEAADLIVLASHLLGIVDRRAASTHVNCDVPTAPKPAD